MKTRCLLFVGIFLAAVFFDVTVQGAAQETLRITCWEGYADDAIVKEFKDLVKKKYKIDVDIKTHYPTDQDEFYKAAKDGTADLISPPAELGSAS
jgi:spermidine/putrescine-binding protein